MDLAFLKMRKKTQPYGLFIELILSRLKDGCTGEKGKRIGLIVDSILVFIEKHLSNIL